LCDTTTWGRVFKKKYASWPGLTWEAVNKHFPESKETLKGHGQKTRSGLQSTKTSTQNDDDKEIVETLHLPRPATKHKEAIIRIYNFSDKAKCLIHTDQTGRFPKKSSRGHQYIMVLIEINSNAILVEAMKNRTTGEMIRAYQVLVEHLRSAGVNPTMLILDNECSAKFKERIKSNNMKYQLVPPHEHRRNIAEKAIQVFKAHFISILCGADKSFPLHLCDRLFGQAEHTLNMLRTSKMTPSVSAYAHLWGEHVYNANPFAPLGCKVEAHVTPGTRETWAPLTASGFYIGNAKKHYQCHKIYICDTKHTQTCLTIFFKHKYLTMPTITLADALICAADYLTDSIVGLVPTPTCTMYAVDQLMISFKQQAHESNDAVTAQRVLREHAQAERVIKEGRQESNTPEPAQARITSPPIFEHKETNDSPALPQGIPQITQNEYDDYNAPPHLIRDSNEKREPSHRTSCSSAWRYQDTMPPSLHGRRHQESIPSNSYVTSHVQSLMTKQETYWSTII